MENTKKLWPFIAGHAVVCFDDTLYGFFAVALAPVFFPQCSLSLVILASYGAFAVSFFARPLGAILFGIMGDKKGRRKPLLWSMTLIGLPTLCIGLIPSYESLGIGAAILLICCRLAQGLCFGGEYTGLGLYIAESFPEGTLGKKAGFLIGAGVFGGILASGVGAFVSMHTMPSWAWRLPFLFGGALAFCIYLFRDRLTETIAFTRAKSANNLLDFPVRQLLRHHKMALATASLLIAITIMPLYFTTILGNQIFKEIGFSTSQSMLFNMGALTGNSIFTILSGYMADKFGFYRQMLLGTWSTAVIAFPAFYLIALPEVPLVNVCLFIGLLVIAGCINSGSALIYIATFFPTNCRYSGVALGVTAGWALFGGTTPLIGSFLITLTGTRMAPAFWLVAVSLAASWQVVVMQRRMRREAFTELSLNPAVTRV